MSNEINESCPALAYQRVGVCVPVTITPFAIPGSTVTKCCGDPVVISGDTPCSGKKNGTCSFTISQTICVEVPVHFGAESEVGDTYVDCLGVSDENLCKDCTND